MKKKTIVIGLLKNEKQRGGLRTAPHYKTKESNMNKEKEFEVIIERDDDGYLVSVFDIIEGTIRQRLCKTYGEAVNAGIEISNEYSHYLYA